MSTDAFREIIRAAPADRLSTTTTGQSSDAVRLMSFLFTFSAG